MAKILSIDSGAIWAAAGLIRSGGLVVYPSETFYALGADATNQGAVSRIFQAKKRSPDKPVSVIVADREMLMRLVDEVPARAQRLMDRFWPGPLTIILRAKKGLPDILTAGTGSIGVRISPHPAASSLSSLSACPLTATSANISGEREPVTPDEVRTSLGEVVDLILDGGKLAGEAPSTMVDMTGETPKILREGAIRAELILLDLEE